MLLNAGADASVVDDQGMKPLMGAAKEGHIEIMAALIKADADVNAKDANGRTALTWASMSNSPATSRVLLDAGARSD